MAKALFHKSQRVFVKPIGTWAHIEQVIPQWAQGVEEPIRVHYDVGMGKRFSADELESEGSSDARTVSTDGEWRVIRGQNKWRNAEDCPHHPYPGSHPLIVTSDRDWGGWRVPGAEYNRDPRKIELQAMLIAKVPVLAGILMELINQVDELEEDIPEGVLVLAQRANEELREAGICATDESHSVTGTGEAPLPVVDTPAIDTATPAELPVSVNVANLATKPAPDPIQPTAGAEPQAPVPEAETPAVDALAVETIYREESAQHFGQRPRPVAQPMAQEMRVAGANYQRPD